MVIIATTIIDIIASVASVYVPASSHTPALFISPTITSFHSRAIIKPKAPPIATAIVFFTSPIGIFLASYPSSNVNFLFVLSFIDFFHMLERIKLTVTFSGKFY